MVESLLLVHDLHPLDLDSRVRRGLERIGPQLGSRAGHVSYLGVTAGVARLELDGGDLGCPSSAQAVRQVIARAVMDAAPEVTDVVVDGLERPSRPTLLQIGRRPANTPATTITLATDTTPATATARPAPSATPSRAPWWGHSTSKGPAMGSRCELCVTEIPAEHGHVADLDQSRLACACRACYLLFTRPTAAHGRYRAVPRRYLADPAHPLSADELDELEIPVGLAFFLRSSRRGEVAGFYPGPAGVTECQLDLAAWERIAAAHPLLTEAEPDVEAILISQSGGFLGVAPPGQHSESATECFCVPIDACYELAGRLRLLWRGLDGGPAARDAVAGLLDEVRANAAVLALGDDPPDPPAAPLGLVT